MESKPYFLELAFFSITSSHSNGNVKKTPELGSQNKKKTVTFIGTTLFMSSAYFTELKQEMAPLRQLLEVQNSSQQVEPAMKHFNSHVLLGDDQRVSDQSSVTESTAVDEHKALFSALAGRLNTAGGRKPVRCSNESVVGTSDVKSVKSVSTTHSVDVFVSR